MSATRQPSRSEGPHNPPVRERPTREEVETIKARAERATKFPGYFVTDDGRVFSETPWRGASRRELAQHENSHGYMAVGVIDGDGVRRKAFVHKLVAAAFLPPKPGREYQLRHLDGNKANNRSANLAWGTALHNAADRHQHGTTAIGERNGASKLTVEQVRAISANEIEKWRTETWEKLGGNAREMLFQLFMHGPVWDGHCVSKAGRGQLFDLNLASRVQGFTFLTYDGVNLAIKAPVREWADKRWWKKQNGC